MKFQEKVVIVAGGTGGLGQAVSLAFLREGARVIATYRNGKEFEALKGAAGASVSNLHGESVDVTDEAAVARSLQRALEKQGRIDALVNTAGGYAGGTKLWELDNRVWDQMFSLNVRSGYVLTRAVVPVMIKQQAGAIVNVSSRAAVDHAAGAAAYAASKAAALAMMDCLAEDVRGTGVRVNTVLPSIIDTPTNRKFMPLSDFSKWPKPEAIARVILFLCSNDAEVIHGAAIPVYGKD
ncbi:MAG TPA: SDR family oxidoreductase [Terriglobales bacterium]|jgi:NAD(P)-dependent dehydrogenase (short-subunit alcohol dehydrogenase family)|nr:SDR family oxidoreductase [Terriglobales bacterium]